MYLIKNLFESWTVDLTAKAYTFKLYQFKRTCIPILLQPLKYCPHFTISFTAHLPNKKHVVTLPNPFKLLLVGPYRENFVGSQRLENFTCHLYHLLNVLTCYLYYLLNVLPTDNLLRVLDDILWIVVSVIHIFLCPYCRLLFDAAVLVGKTLLWMATARC